MQIVDFFFDTGQRIIILFRALFEFLSTQYVPTLSNSFVGKYIVNAWNFSVELTLNVIPENAQHLVSSWLKPIQSFDGLTYLEFILGPGLFVVIGVAVAKWIKDAIF